MEQTYIMRTILAWNEYASPAGDDNNKKTNINFRVRHQFPI